jgi:hypothetical protein
MRPGDGSIRRDERGGGMRRGRRSVVLGVAALVLAGCSALPSSSSSNVRTGPDIVIGVPLAATGNLLSEATMARQGYDLWLDWVNGTRGGIVVQGVRHRVRLDYEDDTSIPRWMASSPSG